jgi:hypothetical protein
MVPEDRRDNAMTMHTLVLRAVAVLALPITAMAQGAPVTAFVNVTVIPMDAERALAGQTVIVQGDRIKVIGPVGQMVVPTGAGSPKRKSVNASTLLPQA